MIIRQIWRVRLGWRPRPITPVIWPWIAGVASRAGLSLTTRRPWMTLAIAIGGAGVVVGGYTCSCIIHA